MVSRPGGTERLGLSRYPTSKRFRTGPGKYLGVPWESSSVEGKVSTPAGVSSQSGHEVSKSECLYDTLIVSTKVVGSGCRGVLVYGTHTKV